MFDEFAIWKGFTPYTAAFTAPTAPYSLKVPVVWTANTFYHAGDSIIPTTGGNYVYIVQADGTSGSKEPDWADGVTDGTITYTQIDTVITQEDIGTGDQTTPAASSDADMPDISSGDFCIDTVVNLDKIFMWNNVDYGRGVNQVIKFYVAGQWKMVLEGDGYKYDFWQLYLIVNPDYSLAAEFVMYDGTRGGGSLPSGIDLPDSKLLYNTWLSHTISIETLEWNSNPMPDNWGGWWAYPNAPVNRGLTNDIRITVSRKGDVGRIFIDGWWSDQSATSTAGCYDMESLAGAEIQIDGHYYPDVNYPDGDKSYDLWTGQFQGNLTVKRLGIFDSAIYWDDFGEEQIPFGQLPGIAIFPRLDAHLFPGDVGDTRANLGIYLCMNPYMINGVAGDTRAKLPIEFNLNAELNEEFPLEINAKLPIPINLGGWLGYNIDIGHLNVTIPMMIGDYLGTFLEGNVSAVVVDFNLTIPMLQLGMEGEVSSVGTIDVSIPMMQFEAEGIINEIGEINVTFPRLKVSMTGDTSVVGTIGVTLPALKAILSGVDETFGILSVTLPALRVSLSGLLGASGTINVSFPMMIMNFAAIDSIDGQLVVSFPMMRAQFNTLTAEDDFINMVMNAKNKALTEYSNYNFNSFGNFNGKNIGAMSDGLYDLSGDRDDGDFIEWNFRSGYLDLEMKNKNKLRQAWFSYKSNGDLMITVILPSGEKYEYDIIGYSEEADSSRVKFGKGIRSKYVMLDVKNVNGSTISLDHIKLHYQGTDKKR